MINGNNQQQLRGVARVQGEIADDADLKTMVGNGYPVITISPEEGERYQGVVGLEGDTLAACRKIISSVQSSCRRALSSAPAIMKASRWRAGCCCR